MAINVCVQYNGGLFPNIIIILLTQGYYHRGTHLNAAWRGFVFAAYETGNPFKCHAVLCVCFLPIHSGHQVRWTYQPGSHRRKVTQDF